MGEQGTARRVSLYRRAADLPQRIDRPTVVQSRARRGPRGAPGDQIPFSERCWLVVAPWPLAGRDRKHALVVTHAEALALATAPRTAPGQDGGA